MASASRVPGIFHRAFHAQTALFRLPGKKQPAPKTLIRRAKRASPKPPPPFSEENAHKALRDAVTVWSKSKDVTRTLISTFGLPSDTTQQLLDGFGRTALTELQDMQPHTSELWNVPQLREEFSSDLKKAIDKACLNRFVQYAADTTLPPTPSSSPSSSSSNPFPQIREIVNMQHPAEWFPLARRMKRKIIMHVGPTNSGKTYNALRALAAAPVGAYAGPLRLLAHEVWERLNNGSITAPPKETGVDLDQILPSESSSTPLPPPIGRPCNLITGEEQRIVSEEAGLVSCTIEMLPIRTKYDVVVIDEIQMLADPARGSAWTNAVLGICAHEVHLCGEATVVDLVRRMAAETGDDFEVHEYKRLTPLEIGPTLKGSLTNVRKGDCVVAFSRAKIFALKNDIEQKTGLRCAVAYGRLPPEVRSEQAQHFNDPTSNYDVMVASDAIGMGLNLKIKRVVFSTMTKWNGTEIETLSLSQTKQIAGRAGRFGLHGDGSVGQATTLHDQELPVLRRAMESGNPDVPQAILELPPDRIETLFETLPVGTRLVDLYNLLNRLTLTSPNYKPKPYEADYVAAEVIDQVAAGAPYTERAEFLNAPVKWREESHLKMMSSFIRTYVNDFRVKLEDALEQNGSLAALHAARKLIAKKSPTSQPPTAKNRDLCKDLLEVLEPMHSTIVLYLWLSYRMPLGFSDQAEGFKLKQDVEKVIDGVLGLLRAESKKARHSQHLAIKAEIATNLPFAWEYGTASHNQPAAPSQFLARFTSVPLPTDDTL